MKSLQLWALSALLLSFAACESEEPEVQTSGTLEVEFDHRVGSQALTLEPAGSQNYPYTTASGQPFNLSMFGYYISEIRLEGPDGTLYEDEMQVSPDSTQVKGYYQVLQQTPASRFIQLENVPVGVYNKITFTVGIAEEGVEEGAAGGVLDPAQGAWFWNWNAGYIGFAMEGGALNSGQEEVIGDSWTIPAKSFALHIGGWKDVVPAAGEEQRFVNNVKTITLDFDSNIRVAEDLEPNAHIMVDVLKVLEGVDFSTTYSVHSPKAGQPFAEKLPEAFILDHTHQ